MAEILNQTEIDALLNEIEDGSGGSENQAPERKRQVSIYDFRHPNIISKDHLRILHIVHETFCQYLENYLSSKLRTLVNIRLIAVDQVTYSEFSLSMSDPSCIYILRVEELQGDAIMELTLPFSFYAVDRLLGGSGRGVEVNRDLTMIEQRVIGSVAVDLVRELNNAWLQILPLNAMLSSYQSRPNFIQIAPIEEIVISISIEVKAQKTTGFINLCFPVQIFESNLSQMTTQQMIRSRNVERTASEDDTLRKKVKSVRVPMQADLGSTSITFGEFLELKTGDVIKLNTRLDDPIQLKINGSPRFTAKAGIANEKLAVKIVDEIEQQED